MGNNVTTSAVLILALASLCRARAQDKIATEPPLYSLSVQNESVLQTILRLGETSRLPMGIDILDTRLCEQKISLNLYNVPAADLLNAALKGSEYSWSLKGDVIEVKPHEAQRDTNAKILNLVIDHFTSLTTTTQGVGIQLRAIIGSTMARGTGYAINILAADEAETIPSFTIDQGSVEEILNVLVSKGSKGVWILYGGADEQRGSSVTGKPVNLKVFGYKDDRVWLPHLSCISK